MGKSSHDMIQQCWRVDRVLPPDTPIPEKGMSLTCQSLGACPRGFGFCGILAAVGMRTASLDAGICVQLDEGCDACQKSHRRGVIIATLQMVLLLSHTATAWPISN